MNDMTQALKTAGVKLPSQSQRIWQYLKDFGPHGVKDVASEMKIGEATVQAAITVMVRRKMLEKIERQDYKGVRLNNHYNALGKVYVLLPEPPKRGAAGRAVANERKAVTTSKSGVEYTTLTLRVSKDAFKVYEAHAKEYGVSLSDVYRLSLEMYAKKMGFTVPSVDPLAELRSKLEGGM